MTVTMEQEASLFTFYTEMFYETLVPGLTTSVWSFLLIINYHYYKNSDEFKVEHYGAWLFAIFLLHSLTILVTVYPFRIKGTIKEKEVIIECLISTNFALLLILCMIKDGSLDTNIENPNIENQNIDNYIIPMTLMQKVIKVLLQGPKVM